MLRWLMLVGVMAAGCGEDDGGGAVDGEDSPPVSGEGEGEPGPGPDDGGSGEGEGERDPDAAGEGEGEPDVAGEGEGEAEGGGGGTTQDLCGDLSGSLPAGGSYTLICPGSVAAGSTLTIGAGSTLDLGTNPLSVEGTLEARDLAVTASLQAGFAVAGDGELHLTGGRVEVVEIEAGSPLFDIDGGTLRLQGVTLVEGEERREAIRARPGADVALAQTRLEGFWIGVAFEGGSTGAVEGGSFVDCLTGVHVVDAARPQVRDSRFEGQGFHLRVDPGLFTVGEAPALSGNEFVGGVPITLSGQVTGAVELAPVDGVERFEVLELGVAEGGALGVVDDLEVALLGTSVEVAGTVEIGAARFPELNAPAFRFDGGGGRIAGATFVAGAAAGVPLVEVRAGDPELSGVTFEDPAGSAVCVRLDGPEATARVEESTLGCWLGVSVEEGVAGLAELTLSGHDTAIRLEVGGSTLSDLTFDGDGVHISLGPSWFGAGEPAQLGLAGHDFGDGGEPAVVGGVLRGQARLVPLIEGEPLTLQAVSVRHDATLTAAAGLELRQGGTSITVDGRAELDQVLFSRLEGPALHWRQEATGRLMGSRLEFVGAGAFPGVRISDSSPTLEDNEIVGGAGGGIGVEVLGNDDVDVPAAPTISGNAFEGLRIGIHVVGDAEPTLTENTFDDVQDEVIESELGGQ